MFKKLFGLFSLENRIMHGVASNLQTNSASLLQKISILEKDISAKSQQIDKLESDINKRLAFIEYHFKDELAAKEKARDESVKAIRLGK